jgi:60 kDa SS-A/Ro ribonucleoprotein
MKVNSAGGASWAVDDWKRMQRFLILGSEGGSYYACERALTVQNATALCRCLESDGPRVVKEIVAVSQSGRAASNDPAIFALALATMHPSAAPDAMRAIPQVCRTATHLFAFVKAARKCRGMGRSLRRGIADWYNRQTPEKLVYQLLKYRQRGGWKHSDVLRLCHPTPATPAHQALYRYAVRAEAGPREVRHGEQVRRYPAVEGLPGLVADFESLQRAKTAEQACRILRSNPVLSWEMVPSDLLGKKEVWATLIPHLPMTALLRNLARMTANGSLTDLASFELVCERLRNPQAIAGARIHPLSVLAALETYRSGASRGALTWKPLKPVVEALDEAFYLAFGNVRPSARRTVLALDVSGSMCTSIKALGAVTCRTASVAMAMVTARVEASFQVVAFCDKLLPLEVSAQDTLPQVVSRVDRLPFGSTDCAQPMIWALKNGVEADTFVIYTDNETWAGNVSPCDALRRYREKTGIPARLVVVGMVSNGFSIADPGDAGMMDVVGFDTAAPELIASFSRGEI